MYGDARFVEVILLLMNVVMKSEWSVRLEEKSTDTLHKDGDVEHVGNYRVIALGCSVVKVFVVNVLVRRLGRFAEDWILTEVQGGFRSGRRCSDQ